RVDSKNPAGATDGEAELGQREQDPQPVPLTGYVEGPQRDIDLPQEATEPGQPRQRTEQEPESQRELRHERHESEEREVRQHATSLRNAAYQPKVGFEISLSMNPLSQPYWIHGAF